MYHRVMQFSLFDNKFLISLNVITQLTLENEAILQIITYVALSFSITGILLTIIVESFIT